MASPERVSAATTTYLGVDNPRGMLTNSNAAFAAFTSTLSTFGTDTIEGFAGFTPDPTLTFGATGITAVTNVDFVATFPALAVSGSNALLDAGPSSATGPAINDTLLFSSPVTAFGTYISNSGDASTANTISLILENVGLGTSETVSIGTRGPGASFDNVLFFGVTTDQPFDKVTIVETFDFDGILLDNITVGTVVPEADSWMLVSIALLGLLPWAYRRVRSVNATA